MTADEKYMKEALRQAKKAEALLEVPIGCVIVQNDKIIARGYNRRNTDKNTLSHAELNAIRKASKKTGDWRLEDCTMYITLEPDVRRGHRPGPDGPCSHRSHEPESRLRRFHPEPSGNVRIQPSGECGTGRIRERMQHHAQ